MYFEFEQLAQGSQSQIAECTRPRDGVRVVMGAGRGCVLYGRSAPVTLLVPLWGRVQLSEPATTYTIPPARLLVVEGSQDVQFVGRGPALWIAVFASARAWCALVEGASQVPEPVFLPGMHEADRLIRRGVIAMARSMSRARPDVREVHATVASVAATMCDLQAEFDPLIERCPGRTRAQRRAVFLRLQRVRNLMMSSCHLELDLADCARIASYSQCHFIRAFSAVYGETPHALLVEQRLRRAHGLLNSSVLAITEVARISGFEDRCAFARSFKRRFGMTASDLRDERHASLQAVA
jgi:AraC family transcriptional regulator